MNFCMSSDRNLMPAKTFVGKTIHRVRHLKRELFHIPSLVFDGKLSETYYPEEVRKSKARVLWDLVVWYVKSGEANRYYYVYGLDRKNGGCRSKELIPYPRFRRIRNRRNLHLQDEPDYNFVCLLRDKFIFGQFLRSLGIPSPSNVALLARGKMTWLSTQKSGTAREVLGIEGLALDLFCKKTNGIMGTAAFPFKLEGGRLWIGGQERRIEEFLRGLDGLYLLQEYIPQHQTMAALHPSSVNTIRLVTVNRDGEVSLLASAQRIGAHGKPVDNWAAGGVIVPIDPESGRLGPEGFFKPGYGGRVRTHPDSGISFEGYELPFFQESLGLVKKLHGFLPNIYSIGWDVAITPSGPTIVEGNDDWEGGIPMVLDPNFKTRFCQLFEM